MVSSAGGYNLGKHVVSDKLAMLPAVTGPLPGARPHWTQCLKYEYNVAEDEGGWLIGWGRGAEYNVIHCMYQTFNYKCIKIKNSVKPV